MQTTSELKGLSSIRMISPKATVTCEKQIPCIRVGYYVNADNMLHAFTRIARGGSETLVTRTRLCTGFKNRFNQRDLSAGWNNARVEQDLVEFLE